MNKMKITFLMMAIAGCGKDGETPNFEQNSVDNPVAQPPSDCNDTATDESGNTPDAPVNPLATTSTFTVGEGANAVSFNMIPVPGGSFLMGAQNTDESSPNYDADACDDEQPVHRVTLSDYAIGETVVTQALWKAVMGFSIQDIVKDDYPLYGEGDTYPMYYVSWDDICGTNGFLAKLNTMLASDLKGKHFVLPTEAQWEFAAAGGQAGYNPDGSRKHKYAGSDIFEEVAWYSSNSHYTTHPVKGKAANELGLYDMSGNVAEWCSDWHGEYSSDDQTDPIGASSANCCVCRGGAWSGDIACTRVASRLDRRPAYCHYYLGFRLALVETVPVTGVSLNKTSLSLGEGTIETLLATIVPNNAINKTVAWRSSNTAVAIVSERGSVIAVAEGTATITVTTTDGGFVATCVVTVTALTHETFTVGEGANAVSFNMIPVQGGSFLMGAQDFDDSRPNYDVNANRDEQPVYRVTLSDYAIGETEVTQALWKAVMGDNPSSFQNGDNYPVESVSWDDICGTDGFLEKLNTALAADLKGKHFALPTEAQWEFAAAGGQAGYNPDGSRKHKYFGSDNVDEVAWYFSNSDDATHPVKGKAANELGLYDMSGNVWERCSDCYGFYPSDDQTDPTGPPAGSDRVIRGGSFNDITVVGRVAYRYEIGLGSCHSNLGLRLALVETVPVTGVSLNKTSLSRGVGAVETLRATVVPNNATNKAVTWRSSNVAVATVNSEGAVTAVAEGTATITVTTTDGGFVATCVLTVTAFVPAPPETFTVGEGENAVSFTMIHVQGGSFLMGAQKNDPNAPNYDTDAEDNEQPVHRVTLSDYAIGETVVTQALWQVMTGDNPDGREDNEPVSFGWDEICGAGGFLDKLSTQLSSQLGRRRFVLPTEAQWEFAAAGGNAGYNPDGSRKHKYSGSDNLDEVGWYENIEVHPVKQKMSNELGLYDMSGNVLECCRDWRGEYSSDDQTDPTGAFFGTNRVGRGFMYSTWDDGAVVSRVAFRNWYYPGGKHWGFRLALAETVPVAGVSLNKTSLSHGVGAVETLRATVVPNNDTNKGVTWRSSNAAVATVNSEGAVTAVAEGTATITVTTIDGGFIATCVVTVTAFAPAPPETFTVGEGKNAVSFTMIPVQGGSFLMGAQKNDPNAPNYDTDAEDNEQPVHRVTLSDYAIGETVVTQALWKAVMGPSIDNNLYCEGDAYPMYHVSWDDICGTNGFLAKLNTMLAADLKGKHFALPTEAQWEFAAAGGQAGYNPDGSRKHKYSGSDFIDDVAWHDGNSGGNAHPVRGKVANELGLYDMSGNVWEWCNDWKGGYTNNDQTDPTGAYDRFFAVNRGGSWDDEAVRSRVAYRYYHFPSESGYELGFRLALVQD